jgi:hypothetical protein
MVLLPLIIATDKRVSMKFITIYEKLLLDPGFLDRTDLCAAQNDAFESALPADNGGDCGGYGSWCVLCAPVCCAQLC